MKTTFQNIYFIIIVLLLIFLLTLGLVLTLLTTSVTNSTTVLLISFALKLLGLGLVVLSYYGLLRLRVIQWLSNL